MTTSRNTPFKEGWLWLFEIKVTSSRPSLYNNLRQQVEITVLAEEGTDENLSEDEMDSCAIVYLDSKGDYIDLPNKGTSKTKWVYTRERDSLYDYYSADSVIPERHEYSKNKPSNVDKEPKSRKFYIHTSAAGGETIKLSARITKSDGTTYYTAEQPYASEVVLNAVPQPAITTRTEITYTEGGNTGRFHHEHSISPANSSIRFVKAEFQPGDKKGMIRWETKHPSETYATHVGIACPGSSKVNYEAFGLVGFNPLKNISSPHHNAVVVLLQGVNNVDYVSGKSEGPCGVQAFDSQGNSYSLAIFFKPEQRVEIDVTSSTLAVD